MNPLGPDGRRLPDPSPCRACDKLIVFIAEGFTNRTHPIEWEGGLNHFLGCSDPDQFGKPKRFLNYCYIHRAFYNAKAPGGCYSCRQDAAARRAATEWKESPPLERFG